MENRLIVDAINEQAEAIEVLAKRIRKKADVNDLVVLRDDIIEKVDEFKIHVAQLTQGMADFFTETLQKNTESNRILFEAIEKRIESTGRMMSAKYQGLNLHQEWLTDYLIDYISKNSNKSAEFVKNRIIAIAQLYQFEHEGEKLSDLEYSVRFVEFVKMLSTYQEEFQFNNIVYTNILSAYIMFLSMVEGVSITLMPVYEYYIEIVRDKSKGEIEEWL